MDLRLSSASLRTGLAATAVAAAVHLAQSRDMVVDFTRPLVLHALHWLGVNAADGGEHLQVGRLLVPWTRDCAGINLLLILLALAVWVNRRETRAWRFWLCMAGMIPAAAAANVLRVLTLLAYRTLAYPGVESPQTHYFIGFLWLVPFITLITPRDSRPRSHGFMETLHAAAVVSLLTPLAGTPNAALLTLATVVALAQCRMREDAAATALSLLLWAAAGLGIAIVGMESFWLPWLLLCPWLASARWVCSLPGIACLACTHSVIVMQPWSWALAAAGLALAWHRGAKVSPPAKAPVFVAPRPHTGSFTRPLAWSARAAFYPSLTLPFLASTLLAIGQQSWQPPAGLEVRNISPHCYEVRLPGQPDPIGLACYSSSSRDRHHTLTVCLKYRGIELSPVEGSPLVLSDGTHWFREFFLQDGRLLPDYPSYVRGTFCPWSDPGVHLIFVTARGTQPPGTFGTTCEALAQRFHAECQPSATPPHL